MAKMMSIVSFLLIIAVLAIVVLKMSGQGELVDKTSSALVGRLGLNDIKQSNDAFAKEALGWDIRDIKTKRVATVKAGKARLQKVIDDLEKIRLKNKVVTAGAEFKKSESQEEMKGLLDSIHAAQAHLKDPAAAYPATIKGFSYANKRQLESAAAKAIRRYQTLKRASTLKVNNPTYGDSVTVNIEKRLDIAYQIMELLDARLALAEMQENADEFNESNKELASLEARANVIVADGEEAVQQLPQGFTSGSDRDANTINSFTE